MTILRDMPLDDGRQGLVLLSQVEHARIAGEIAAAWGGPHVEPIVPRAEIVDAVFHHDDGWSEWERHPDVDPITGNPYAFTDMPGNVKFAIWRKSIAAALALGPLPAAVVARHFIGLERGTNRWQETGGYTDSDAREFIECYTALADQWIDQWSRESPSNTESIARRGREWLQWFDVLSLWLCMSERRVPQRFDAPSTGAITMQPQATITSSSACIVVDPWPFQRQAIRLKIEGQHVHRRRYRDAADLANEAVAQVQLCWNLLPG